MTDKKMLVQMENWLKSDVTYPVDFEIVWKWLGYTTKQKAKLKLQSSLTENKDFVLLAPVSNATGGRPLQPIFLTIDAFKQFAMMSRCKRGREVREYFIEIEKRFLFLKEGVDKGTIELKYKGNVEDWKNERVRSIQTTKEKAAAVHEIVKGQQTALYGILNDIHNRTFTGMSTQQFKEQYGLKKREPVKSRMSKVQLALYQAQEYALSERLRNLNQTSTLSHQEVIQQARDVAAQYKNINEQAGVFGKFLAETPAIMMEHRNSLKKRKRAITIEPAQKKTKPAPPPKKGTLLSFLKPSSRE